MFEEAIEAEGACLCPCGLPVLPRSRFVAGHTTRLRGLVARVNRGEDHRSSIPARSWVVLSTCRTCGTIGFSGRGPHCGC